MRPLRRRLIIAVHDLGAAMAAFLVALYLRLGNHLFARPPHDWLMAAAIFTATAGIVFYLGKLHRGAWRYTSIPDLALLLKASTVTVLVFIPLCFLLTRLADVPRSVPVIAWFVLVTFLGGARLAYRLRREGRLADILTARRGSPHVLPVLLVGAGDEADMFLRTLEGNRESAYRVQGVIDTKPNRVGQQIRGVPVLGELKDLTDIVSDLRKQNTPPAKLILTQRPGRIGHAALKGLFEQAGAMGLDLARLPAMTLRDAANTDAPSFIEPRPIALEDLLGRPEAVLDRAAIAALVAGQRIFVTGAGGSIGSELCRQIASLAPAHITLCDSCEFNLYSIDLALRESHPNLSIRTCLADVREGPMIQALVQNEKPEIIFHAAALKHVPLMEQADNIRAAILTNVMGTQNVADAAALAHAKAMILISSDKAVNPTNIMGATKRLAESYCQACDLAGSRTRFITVRFGNVLGSTGSVVPRFAAQIAAGGPVTVTDPDVTRYFMTIREAVELVLQASARGMAENRETGERGRIFVLDMGEPIRIADLARQMIRLAGRYPDTDIAIEIVGLRPGEKRYEELFLPAEAPLPSGADGVLVAAPEPLAAQALNRDLAALFAVCADERDLEDQAMRLRALLADLVPSLQDQAADGQDDVAADNRRRKASSVR